MENHFLIFKWFVLHFLLGVHHLWMTSGLEPALNESDRLALLDFKRQINQDPLQIMRTWNDSVHFCKWVGVTCGPSSGRVEILNLESQQLVGSIPTSIGNLTYLTGINLRNNSFRGEVPQEIGRLQRLRDLNLTRNNFSGKIPTNLTRCTELRIFEASVNAFIGQMPDEFSSLPKLVVLGVSGNNLTGIIPASIGNLSSLFALSLAFNNFQGSIPKELGQLSGLGFFQLSANHLSGTVPSSIYNISSIYLFSVTQNQLHGQLPSDVGLTLPNLELFAGGENNFTGGIPLSLSNASKLQFLDFAQNGFTGGIPVNLGRFQSLIRFNFEDNRLGNGEIGDLNFLNFLSNCSSLQALGLHGNNFGGELPSSIANLSIQLQILTMGLNLIHGTIPVGIGNLVSISFLALEGNYLIGSVPDVIGRLLKLEGLWLNSNNFSGSIPSSLGNLTRLIKLFLDDNKFEGSIPPNLGNCQKLLELDLSTNNLNGTIPSQVMALSSLTIYLRMSRNFLTGSLPLEVGKLINLAELDAWENKLSGEIPSSIGSCIILERLYLGSNNFEGTIPQSLRDLRGLEELDLSGNNLTGQIPNFLGELVKLRHLNLSYNELDGEVSREGIFANASAISLVGNNKLCGGVLELLLPTCSREVPGRLLQPKVLIPVTIAAIFVILLSCSFVIYFIVKASRRHSRRQSTESANEGQWGMSYSEVSKSTDNFSEQRLIGSGGFGSVYKGILSGNRTIVAIKVLKLQEQEALKSFMDECNVYRNIRHRNILRVITACSSVDHQGNDFKALVFQYMSNGSLDKWLYPNADDQFQIKRLGLMQRLNIAIDVASALEYLHHRCHTPIVHCDLKPSNVLLDEDMVAHVGDFGLARFLFEASNNPSETISVALRGSVGYIPPEYTAGQVSILGDMYSYGILLLEMFTGKRPTDDMFKEELNIHKFVLMAMPDHVMDIVDPSMLIEEQNEDEKTEDRIEAKAMIVDIDPQFSTQRKLQECLVSVIQIGLKCSTTLPRERMAMDVVVNNLQAIRNTYVSFKNRKRRKMK